MHTERLYRVEAPHFCAGLVVGDGSRVVEAEPGLQWALGKHWIDAYYVCVEAGWRMELVLQPEIEPVWRQAKRLLEEM